MPEIFTSSASFSILKLKLDGYRVKWKLFFQKFDRQTSKNWIPLFKMLGCKLAQPRCVKTSTIPCPTESTWWSRLLDIEFDINFCCYQLTSSCCSFFSVVFVIYFDVFLWLLDSIFCASQRFLLENILISKKIKLVTASHHVRWIKTC